ncbi:hypothetical protein, partial [Lyngbya sp. CCY1209]|uniref:hypothetical protein n=1 Tax=Lyngbya sp. CCY1209 TaxID=2886103 RepID=UPI002D20517E
QFSEPPELGVWGPDNFPSPQNWGFGGPTIFIVGLQASPISHFDIKSPRIFGLYAILDDMKA